MHQRTLLKTGRAGPAAAALRGLMVLMALAAFVPLLAFAQTTWPARPIRFVVPFAPSGGGDVIARLVVPRLSDVLRQPIVIENKPGASGLIGAEAVARSAPDGYTLLLSNNASISTGPLVQGTAGYQPLTDFEHVLMISSFANGFLVNANHLARSFEEFLGMARARPGRMTFASAAVGSAGHLTGEMIKQRARIDMVHVPYKGTGPAIADLMAGQIDAIFDGLPASTPYVRSGKLRLLAISSQQRLAHYPETPTMDEIVPGVSGFAWFGISAPAGTPRDIVDRLQLEGRKVLALPDLQARFAELGMVLSGRGQAEYTEFIADDIRRWTPVVKAAGVRLQGL